MAANKGTVTFTLKELGLENILSQAVKNLEQQQAFLKSISTKSNFSQEVEMAINVAGVTGEDLLALLDVSMEDKVWMQAAQPVIHVQATQIVMALDGVEPASVVVKVENVLALKKGTLSQTAKQALQLQFKMAIKKLKKAAKAAGVEPDDISEQVAEAISTTLAVSPSTTLNMLPPLKKPGPSNQVQIKWQPMPFDQITAAQPVKLRDAGWMYQPVFGTSANSRYFLVAARDDLKVAVRYKDNSLGIRVEGSGFGDYVAALSKAGFTGIVEKGTFPYASMHLSLQDPTLARKSLGAVLLAIGPIWETPFPDIEALKNKGV